MLSEHIPFKPSEFIKWSPNDDLIEVGLHFMIDIYNAVVGPLVQVDPIPERTKLVDLTETTDRTRQAGRFGAFIESDDEEQVEIQASTDLLVVSKETGPMKPPELNPISDRHRSKVQRPKPSVKPWIGPIPKFP